MYQAKLPYGCKVFHILPSSVRWSPRICDLRESIEGCNSRGIVWPEHPCLSSVPEFTVRNAIFDSHKGLPRLLTSIKMIDGLPTREIAVDSLRLFPPEYCPTGRSAHSVRPSRFNKQSASYSRTGVENVFLWQRERVTGGILCHRIPRKRA